MINYYVGLIMVDVCQDCGRSVEWGSGRFCDRIPDFDSYEDRVEKNCMFPEGAYICEECDQDWYDNLPYNYYDEIEKVTHN